MKIDAVPSPTNTLLKPQDYAYLRDDSRARVPIVSEPLVAAIEPIRDRLRYLKQVIVVGTPRGVELPSKRTVRPWRSERRRRSGRTSSTG